VNQTGEPLDLAVVGAGTAGLYCAWRAAIGAAQKGSALSRPGGPPRIGLFEASDRVGGRIHTVVPDGARTLRGELGGIALMSGHELLMGLVEHLGLAREPLRGGDPHDLLYLRGHRFTAADWRDAEAVPYDLAQEERGRTPEDLLAGAIETVVPDARSLDPHGWDEIKRRLSFDGRPLTDWGLWNLMRELVSPEAFRLMSDAGSFRPQFENWNAAEAIADLCADWPQGSRYERLRDGYEALPAALAEGFRAAGGTAQVGHRLQAVDRSDDPNETLALTFETAGGATTTVLAKRVVLALPQAGLARLSAHTPIAGDPGFASDLESVYAIPLFHVLLGYERPWWEAVGIETGRSATDLPIQTCFYFGSEDPAADEPDQVRRSLAMVGYSSPEAIAFWDAYLAPTGVETGEPAPRVPPPEMLAEVTRQLSALHGIEASKPYWALLMDWRGDPYGGASHRWAVGTRSWEVIPRMREPLPGLGLHVCGEAWSDCQGWVEGGLRSAERVLQDELGLKPPEWLAADAYFGP
jgi:monoamine oxidase